ncbi:tetratricopeptide repeat protein [Winogradskyella algicola]|uniref:tetratricopeptide repeat protein n=1 Tax=Winogradskyella algicola TaxID=2575815 RepID=UPI001109BA9D|nr:tetratricopeptide repeat protein [Winogradskyella algicola]
MRTHLVKSLFFLFIMGYCSVAISQNKIIDSLKLELRNHKTKDTTHVNLLYSLAFSSFQSDLKLTLSCLEDVVELSDSLNYTKGKAKSSYLYGILENRKSNYAKSLELFKKSQEYYESIGDKNGIAATYTAFGITHFDLAQYDEAIEDYKKATEIYEKLGNEQELIQGLNRVANIYTKLGNYDEAINQYKQVIARADIVDEQTLNITYSNLGVVYRYQGKYAKAIEYYNKYLDSRKKDNDKLAIARTLGNLGELYIELNKDDIALDYLQEALVYATEMDNKPSMAIINMNLGNLYLRKKDYDKALVFFNRSLEVSLEINKLDTVTFCYHNIGEAYFFLDKPIIARNYFEKAVELNQRIGHKLGLAHNYLGMSQTFIKQKEFRKGLEYALKSKKNGNELESLEIEKKAEYLQSLAYEGLGNYKKALSSHQQYKVLHDSLFSIESLEKIARLEAEYKYKQALDSANIRELKLTKTVQATSQDLQKSQRNYLWAIIGVLLLSILLGAIMFNQKLKNAKSKTQTAIIEQKLLRSQMTPHFIFNSLSVLQGMILNKEDKKSVQYLSKFSKLLRITLENSRDKTVLLSQELTAVQDYLTLQNLENDTYECTILVDNSIDTELFQIPPMLIQPFVENAIEHAFVNMDTNPRIDIKLRYVDKKLVCTIADNGVGIDYENGSKRKDKKSLATTITSERLKMLSKDLDINGSVHIEDRKHYNEQGTIVTLVIPYKKEVA